MRLEVIQKEMMQAMKDKNKERKEALASLVGNIKKVAIDEMVRDDIPEELVDRVVMKELKTIKEQIDTCPKDREEILKKYQYNYDVVSEFAPKMLSKDELMDILNSKFREVISTKNKGQIMKAVMGELKGKADGKVINECVTELCK